MGDGKARFTISVDRSVYRKLEKEAAEEGVAPARLAALVVENWLAAAGKMSDRSPERAEAERRLLGWVAQFADRLRSADDWDEHVILHVFERIKAERPDLYGMATVGGHESRINKQIGALVRARLNADVIEHKGRRRMGQPSRRLRSLIQSYTLLYRRKEA